MRYKLAFNYFKRHKFNHGDIRNFRLGGIVSVYGLSFAAEKFLLAIGSPLSDFWWTVIYGVFAAASLWFWLEDAILDLWEENTFEDEVLEGKIKEK
ncbi:hypothetical protein AU106_gp202 [Sinorhizobium phage phiM9]|uniref:Transmembrane protein n=1 Tax=Sinorhizobium phage phiM9 TaxID=1636182 RepID=A0A0F6R7P7_9CAUD|nr:hypothetical protein AU106_gp202 [Sinorhizobium phage phiM9]AKE44833.1 hypothetical protein Sm_phiM9_206 [Sinorhizobium phage phiM9]